jgi:hypothetical protein
MKYIYLSWVVISLLHLPFPLLSQTELTYKVHQHIAFGLAHEFDPLRYTAEDVEIFHVQKPYPAPLKGSKDLKSVVNAFLPTTSSEQHRQANRRSASAPIVTEGFSGALGAGIPNDNNVAVSPSGWVVSVLNTHVRVYKTNGEWLKNWTLESFPRAPEQTNPGPGVKTLVRSYDPKIVFDHEANRFILVYLEGSESTNTHIITAFSKSDNPLDGWYVYQINGNPFGGKTWSDYPIIGISKQDLYVTVNILKDSTDWRDGFTQSVIWQIPKKNGFDGDSLLTNLISDIAYNGQPLWSICAIPAGLDLFEKGMFFLSVRPGDLENDTVFLHRIHNNFSDGVPNYTLQILQTNLKYGLPPNAYQPSATHRLQSNDARVLSGFVHAGNIQYTQTSRSFTNNRSAIYHGIIRDVYTQPTITARLIQEDTLDFAYPSIVYAGDGGWNQNAIITFSHSSEKRFPGASIIYMDQKEQYSPITTLKEGEGLISVTFLPDSMQRWGDYTGIQRDFNTPGAFWTSGSFGNAFNRNGTWINQVLVNDIHVSTQNVSPKKNTQNHPYPNPASDQISLSIELPHPGNIHIQILDILGKVVKEHLTSSPYSGRHTCLIPLHHLPPGKYLYVVIIDGVSRADTGSFIIH